MLPRWYHGTRVQPESIGVGRQLARVKQFVVGFATLFCHLNMLIFLCFGDIEVIFLLLFQNLQGKLKINKHNGFCI